MTTLPAGHPDLISRLAEALEALLTKFSAREISGWLNCKDYMVSARGHSVRAWDIVDLIIIGEHFAPVRDTLCACINGDKSAIGHATHQENHPSVSQACDLLIDLAKRREQENQTLIPVLIACICKK